MYKVVFRIKNKETGTVSTTISSGYVDTRIAALSYANAVKQEHLTDCKTEVLDFHVIGIGGIRK